MPESVSPSEKTNRSGAVREALFHLDWRDIEAIGWGELLSHCRDAGIHDIEMLEGDCCQCVCELATESVLEETVLTDLACVNQCEFLAETDGRYHYLLELTATELPEEITENHEELIGTCEPSLSDDGITMSLLGPQEQIRDTLRSFETADATPKLRKLSAYRGHTTSLESLTARQLQVIETAFELGFYEVPRQASTEDIADELNIDAATISEHLQRGERNLLRQELQRT